MTGRKIVYWDAEGREQLYHETRDEAIAAAVDLMLMIPPTLELNGYARTVPSPEGYVDATIDTLIEQLDERYGNPDDWTEVTEGMKKATLQYVEDVLAEYEPWRYDIVHSEIVDLLPWLEEHMPGRVGDLIERKGPKTDLPFLMEVEVEHHASSLVDVDIPGRHAFHVRMKRGEHIAGIMFSLAELDLARDHPEPLEFPVDWPDWEMRLRVSRGGGELGVAGGRQKEETMRLEFEACGRKVSRTRGTGQHKTLHMVDWRREFVRAG